MIIATGIDLVEIDRIEKIIARWQNKFVDRIFTVAEKKYCYSKKEASQHFAVRFAAKEALYKMLAVDKSGISWLDMEITREKSGKPAVKLSGEAQKLAFRKNIEQIHISLSHEKKIAIASVIGEGVLNSDHTNS